MAQFARPDADVNSGTWSVTPLFDKIDETPYSDADSISGPNKASGTCEIGLSTLTDPVSSVSHTMRVRGYKFGTGDIELTIELYQGTTLIKSWVPAWTGAFAGFEYTLTTGEADSITDYTDLRVKFVQTYTTGSQGRSYASWFEFEVPTASGGTTEETASTTEYKGITASDQVSEQDGLTTTEHKGIVAGSQTSEQDGVSAAKYKGVSALDGINAGELTETLPVAHGLGTVGNMTIDVTLWDPAGMSLLDVSENNRYLVDINGAPVLLVGDAAWELLQQVPDADQDVYLANRQAKGFNAVIIEAIEHHFCTNAPNDYYNNPPFTSTVFTTPNETYFARLDALLTKMQSYGMVALLFPLYLGYDPSEDGWDTEVAAASNADMTWWGNYLGNRYKDFPNIIWVLGGDRDPTVLATKIDYCADALLAADTNHLITVHAYRNSLATNYVALFPWLTFNNIYPDYLDISSLSGTGYAYSPTMPFFDIEATYEGNGGLTPQAIRAQMYWSILAGGCGYIFGNSVVWNLGFLGGNWKTSMDLEGSNDMARFATFIKSKEWHSLVPDSAHSVLTVGYGTIDTANYATCARVADGSLVLIYMPSNRTMTVDMTKLSGTVTCRWFDPTDGSYVTDGASPLPNTDTHDFSRATANSGGDADWVLVLEA